LLKEDKGVAAGWRTKRCLLQYFATSREVGRAGDGDPKEVLLSVTNNS